MPELQFDSSEVTSAPNALVLRLVSYKRLDYPLGRHRIQHLQGCLSELAGNLESAEKSYLEALNGFLYADEPRLAVFVSLELAVLDSREHTRARALDLTRWCVPVLQSMKLHQETTAAIELLARETASQQIDERVLVEMTNRLRLDPLAQLDRKWNAGRISRPPCLSP